MAEHNTTAPLPVQGQDLIYALDIGTRSIIGLLATRSGDRMCIQAMATRLHTRRVMVDGQIEDIGQVADAVREVTARLEAEAGCRLCRACVAAAGRALRTERGQSTLTQPAPEPSGSPSWRPQPWPTRSKNSTAVRMIPSGCCWWAIPPPATSSTAIR